MIETLPESLIQPYQHRLADFIYDNPNCACWVDMGLGKTVLDCDMEESLTAGDVTVAIRPEDIEVQEASHDSADGNNIIEVTIDEVEFLGSFVRADITSESINEAHLRADLSINLVRRLELAEGSRVSVALPRERIRVYPKNA